MSAQPKKRLVLLVSREWDGQVISEVVDKASIDPERRYVRSAVVIDRARGRGLDNQTVMRRGKMLATLLGIPYEEDLEWTCQASRKLRCHCPKCIEEGRA